MALSVRLQAPLERLSYFMTNQQPVLQAYVMKTKLFLWSAAVVSCLSCAWVFLLMALVIRCGISDQPFPVLAKFSPFRAHLVFTDKMLQAFPLLALMAFALVSIGWYRQRAFRPVRSFVAVVAVSILVSVMVAVLNPGGYVSWFLS